MIKPYINAITAAALAATCAYGADDNAESGNKIIEIVRIDTPPVIDGRLDEDLWKRATVIEDLHQVLPYEYAAPNERTVFYLAYDKDALYVGARAWYSNPEEITARILKQGSPLMNEDRVGVILDPFNDKRSGYMFEVNPNGVRLDGLFLKPTQFSPDWDGIWRAEAQYLEDGYSVEYAIPFKTLSFNPENHTWGLNVWREVVRNQEMIGWVSYNRAWNPSAAGEVKGLRDLDIGKGLDLVPSMSLRQIRNFNGLGTKYELEPSLDVFYKISPQLNGSLTINTDFSATEIDDRQVDLTRFSLFFPEKRDFFLKDSDIFEFGNIGGLDFRSTFSPVELEDGRPFFSRKIGLSNTGEPVDLDYGGKISGRVGQWNVGAQAIRQAAYGDIDATNIFVGRVSHKVLNESSIGAILTYGDPTSNLDNVLGGVDFRYLNTNLPGGRTLEGEVWYQKSDTEGLSGNDSAWAVGLRMPNTNRLRAGIAIKELQKNFYPALGFANRRGTRTYQGEVGYTYRPAGGLLRVIYAGVDVMHVHEMGYGLQTQNIRIRPLELTTFQGDYFRFHYNLGKEGLSTPFEISRGIVLPRGLYTFNRYGVAFGSGPARKLTFEGSVWNGDFYDGSRFYAYGGISWRPSKHFNVSGSYEFNDINLIEGNFITRLITFKSDVVLNNTMSWTSLVQFDNISNNLGINSRLHWEPEAGRDVYFVINYNMLNTEEGFVSTHSDITLKASYTFRF